MKKILLRFSIMVMLVLCFSFMSGALEVKESGTCGEGVNYVIYTDGSLIISGNGEIDRSAFYDNDDITSVVIENGVTAIGCTAFYDCDRLKSVVMADSVTELKNYTYLSDWEEDFYTTIPGSTFRDCDALETIKLSNSLSTIPAFTFYYCTNLKEITLPNSITELEYSYSCGEFYDYFGSTFANCSSLKKITLSSNLENLSPDCFAFCTSLKEIVIPDSVTELISNRETDGESTDYKDANTFKGCTALEKISLPKNLKFVPARCFADCTSLKEIMIPEGVELYSYYTNYTASDLKPAYDKYEEKSAYIFENCTSLEKITIKEGTKFLGKGIFKNCSSLKSIALPETLVCIGDSAFLDCVLLEDIVIPEAVSIIGKYAFENCKALISVTVPEAVQSIGEDAFYGCKSLTDITINNADCEINDSSKTIYAFATIYGHKKSTAQIYAMNWNREFAEIGNKHTHSYAFKITKAASCTEKGYTNYSCSCGESYVSDYVNALGHTGGTTTCTAKAKCSRCKQYYGNLKKHTYTTSTTKATLSKDGKITEKCTSCSATKTTSIYKIKSVKLSSATLAYTGKNLTPSVTVKDSKGKTLKKGTDYTVTYPKKRKSIGKYTVTVTFKGNYIGTKKLTFEIVPAKVTLSKLTAGSKQLTATWKTVSGVTGYEVMYSTSKKFTKKTTKTVTIKKAKTKKTTIKKLKKGKKYYVKVRAYKTVGKNKIYGAWSAVKNVKVK